MTNFVYLLFGSQRDCYPEAAYSIGTLLKNTDPAKTRIIVYADQPETVRHWPVTCEPLSHRLAEWKGRTNYHLRVKICACLDCMQQQPGNLIFLDSDTFVRKNPKPLADRLSPGHAFLHDFESRNPLPALAGFQHVIAGLSPYEYNWTDAWMWNTGVIALHRQDMALLHHALDLCDALLAAGFGERCHVIEQFAISEVLRLAGVKINPARGRIVHYYKGKTYMRQRISRMQRLTGKEAWQLAGGIWYWPPYVKFEKWWSRLSP